ncbi:MAG: molybdopterin dinucleotide binding domain-containing protein [Candidatus Krumholzibacteriia bacterium]
MTQTRRNFLKFCGGATVGMIASPLPWKLLDDAAIWTQNWSWIARPPRGPQGWRYSACTLCPAGCGLKARLIGDLPVSAWAVPGHPVSGGCVCPAGLGLAQIRFHPARIRRAQRRVTAPDRAPAWRPEDTDLAIADVGHRLRRLRDAGALDRVGILDLRPGRALSTLQREFLARLGGGRYLTLPDGRELAAATLPELVGPQDTVPGADLARADVVISFGAALHDGWRGGGPAAGLRGDHAPELIQVESNTSVTATLADRWLPVRPGSEVVLALGLAHVLLADDLVPASTLARIGDLEAGPHPGYRDLVRRFSPRDTAAATGCEPRDLVATAHRLASARRALAVGGGDPGGGPLGREEEAAIWGLNLLLGAVGGRGAAVLRHDLGGIFAEPDAPSARSLRDLPDGSLELLIVDGAAPGAAIPADLLRRKLAGPDRMLVALSPFASGAATAADLVLPVQAPGEWSDDVPARALAPRTTYMVAPAIAAAPAGIAHPADLLDRLAAAAGGTRADLPGSRRHADLLRRRAGALHARGRGEVFDPADGSTLPVANLPTADHLVRLLDRGGCWSEDPTGSLASRPVRLLGADGSLAPRFRELADGRLPATTAPTDGFPLVLMARGRQGLAGGGPVPPVVNKLYREAHLHAGCGRAHVNPATAAACGLRDGAAAALATPRGRLQVTVVCDEAVMPGVVQVAVGPSPADLGDPAAGASDILMLTAAAERPIWRVEPAALEEVPRG